MTDETQGYSPLEPKEERTTSFKGAEEILEPGADYRARVKTNKGTIIIDLFQDQAPRTVNNFVFLALNRYYDGVPFHRVLEDFMAQTGDPTGTGRGGPGYTFADEVDSEVTHDAPGTISMANAGPDTNGSQFFITFSATPWLDGRHTVFGRVVEGEEILGTLQRVDPSRPSRVEPDRIERITILTAA
ncbi:MAG: peptidylprolyl isomerase [Trueperaceae bacterium]